MVRRCAYEKLRTAWDDDRPATTLLRARAYLRRHPADAVAWGRMGTLLTRFARHSEARAALGLARRHYEEEFKRPSATLRTWTGQSYERSGHFPMAEGWYRRAVEARPDDADGYGYLGRLLCRWGRLADAEVVQRRAVACAERDADHDDSEPAFDLGVVLRARERYAEAARAFRKSLAIDPDVARTKRALADVEQAPRLARRRSTVRTGYGCAELGYQRMKRAWRVDMPALNVVLAERCLRIAPENYAVRVMLGEELTALSRYEEARVALAEAIRARRAEGLPPYVAQCFYMARVYRRCGNFAAAEAWYRRAVAADPDDAGPHIFLGGFLTTCGRYHEAEQVYRRATTCASGAVDEAWLNLGYVMRATERFTDALGCFRRAVRIDPCYEIAKEAIDDVRAAVAFRESGAC
jgi:tetratricopeptide (TPR) repeat protein